MMPESTFVLLVMVWNASIAVDLEDHEVKNRVTLFR